MGRALGALIGASFFLWIAGTRALDPGEIGWLIRYSSCDTSVAASRSSSDSNSPSLLPKWYFTSAALTPDLCAISDSDTSIEARPIISSLAATSSFSAVEFLPPASLVGTLVFN